MPDTSTDKREQIVTAMEALVRLHDGNATQALLDLADHYKIAVSYLDREWFDTHLKTYHDREEPLSDFEWHIALGWHLPDYDAFVSQHGENCIHGSLEVAFAEKIIDESGILGDDQDEGEDR